MRLSRPLPIFPGIRCPSGFRSREGVEPLPGLRSGQGDEPGDDAARKEPSPRDDLQHRGKGNEKEKNAPRDRRLEPSNEQAREQERCGARSGKEQEGNRPACDRRDRAALEEMRPGVEPEPQTRAARNQDHGEHAHDNPQGQPGALTGLCGSHARSGKDQQPSRAR